MNYSSPSPIPNLKSPIGLPQFQAFSLASLYAIAYTLSSTVLFWIVDSPTAAATTSPTLYCPPSASPVPQPNPLPLNPRASAYTLPVPQSNGGFQQLPNLNPAIPQPPPTTPAQSLNPGVSNPTLPPVGVGSPGGIANPTNSSTQLNRYRLGVGDTISVSVQRFPDLSFQAIINTEGDVVTPLLGAVSIAGLTVEEAQEKLRCELNRYVIEPSVTLILANQRPALVTVTGEVSKPGFYIFQPGSQLAAALFVAGGTTSSADLRGIIVRRTLVDGSIIQQNFDLFTPLQNGEPLPNLRLQDGDAVVVPKIEVGTDKDYDRRLAARSSLSQPRINIRILSYASGGIGNIQLENGSTFVDAIAAISPNPDNANLDSIALIRFDPEQGKAVTQQLNANEALKGNVAQNVPLQNNDVIVVGRTLIAEISHALNIFTQPFRDTLGFLLFFDSLRGSATNLFGPK